MVTPTAVMSTTLDNPTVMVSAATPPRPNTERDEFFSEPALTSKELEHFYACLQTIIPWQIVAEKMEAMGCKKKHDFYQKLFMEKLASAGARPSPFSLMNERTPLDASRLASPLSRATSDSSSDASHLSSVKALAPPLGAPLVLQTALSNAALAPSGFRPSVAPIRAISSLSSGSPFPFAQPTPSPRASAYLGVAEEAAFEEFDDGIVEPKPAKKAKTSEETSSSLVGSAFSAKVQKAIQLVDFSYKSGEKEALGHGLVRRATYPAKKGK